MKSGTFRINIADPRIKSGEDVLPYRDWGLGGEESEGFNRNHSTVGGLRVHRNMRDHDMKKSHPNKRDCISLLFLPLMCLHWREIKPRITRKKIQFVQGTQPVNT